MRATSHTPARGLHGGPSYGVLTKLHRRTYAPLFARLRSVEVTRTIRDTRPRCTACGELEGAWHWCPEQEDRLRAA